MRCRHAMLRSDGHPARATWGARCGKSARRVLRGGTSTSDTVARPVPTHHNLDKSQLVRFVEHRVADPRILRLIQKWLNAGVMEDGIWSNTKTGSPQGSVISPLLANIYLHYAFDLWVNVWREKWARGEVVVIRYADDVILGFQHQ